MYLKVGLALERMLAQQVAHVLEGYGEGLGERPHGQALDLAVQDGGARGEALGAEPELAGQVLLHDVVRKLDPEVSVRSGVRYQLVHDLVADGQHTVLTVAQLVHEARAALRLLSAVERVQLRRHAVQRLVGVEELRQQALVLPLRANGKRCVRVMKFASRVSFVFVY